MARRSYRERTKYRTRRFYIKRKSHKMKEVGLFDLLGLGTGLGMSAFGPNGADFENLRKNPADGMKLAFNGMIAGITGYDMTSQSWKISNMQEFWIPMLSFHIADWLFKKFGLNHIKIFKNIRLA